MKTERSALFSFFTLLTSSSTLICCALPALLVTLGLGTTLGSLVSAVPQLRWITLHKVELFALSAIILTIAGILQYRARYAPCPLDPELARSCMQTRRISRIIYFISVGIYLTGFSFAYIIPRFI